VGAAIFECEHARFDAQHQDWHVSYLDSAHLAYPQVVRGH
jgi:hypothetical protein